MYTSEREDQSQGAHFGLNMCRVLRGQKGGLLILIASITSLHEAAFY